MIRYARNTWFYFFAALVMVASLVGYGIVIAGGESPAPQVWLKSYTFDPVEGEPPLPPELTLVEVGGVSSLYLVQFQGPVTEAQKQSVLQSGARLYGYIPDFTFLARMTPSQADMVRRLSHIRWVGLYQPAYRLSPDLANPGKWLAVVQPTAQPLPGETLPVPEDWHITLNSGETIAIPIPTPEYPLMVQTLPDIPLEFLAAQMQALGGRIQAIASNALAGYIRVNIPVGSSVQADLQSFHSLAALDGVVWVEPYFEPQLDNNIGGAGIMNISAVRQSLGLYGAGQIVAVADSGLDVGILASLHADVLGRVLKTYALGRTNDWSDGMGHGTHVAGSVLGSGVASGANPGSHAYTNSYAGNAPEASLVFQSLMDASGGLGGIPTDRGDLMRTAYTDGARIHTNSWGGQTGSDPNNPTYGGYVITSQQVDQAAWEKKDMLILYSAGNNGVDVNKDGLVDADSIGQPGTAKNVLTVGASENDRPTINNIWGSNYSEPVASDLRADNPDGMAAFSSRGPTDDGRIKPELVAPGTFIASIRTQKNPFVDNLEGDTSGYIQNTLNGGTAPWTLVTNKSHSASHSWAQTLNGSYNAQAMTALFTPVFDVMQAGTFLITFHTSYNLSGDDQLYLILLAPDINNTSQSKTLFMPFNVTGNQASFVAITFTAFSAQELIANGFNPTAVRVGFGITSQDTLYQSSWWVDDLRMLGAGNWGTMSMWGLASPGDPIDEAYVMQGGTSMATPLTAGAAALVREWLTRIKSIVAPSGALIKALLINGAADMSPGQYTSPQEVPSLRPNPVTGWGRVDVEQSLMPAAPQQVWMVDNTSGLGTGEQVSYQVVAGIPAIGQAAPGAIPVIQEYSVPAGSGAGESNPVPIVEQTPVPPSQRQENAAPHQDAPMLAAALPVGARLAGDQAGLPLESVAGPAWPYGTDLISNGGFEADTDWYGYYADYSTAQAHTGSRSAGSTAAIDGYFYQIVHIPADATSAILTYYWMNVDPDHTYDLLQAFIYTPDLQTQIGAAPQVSADDTNWHGHMVDIAEVLPYILGQDVAVLFNINQDDISPHAVFYVDDVSLMVETPSAATNTPTPTPTKTSTTALTRTPTPTPTRTNPPGNTPTPTPTRTGGPSATPTATQPVTTGPLRFTLVWMDYPGQPAAAKALVNDLDLEVIAPDGTHYYGNTGVYGTGSNCLRSGHWDACNNVEGVWIPHAQAGTYTVIVHGYEVSQGGKQPFAVVGSGDYLRTYSAVGTPTPTPTGTLNTPTPTPTRTVTVTMPPGAARLYLPLVRR